MFRDGERGRVTYQHCCNGPLNPGRPVLAKPPARDAFIAAMSVHDTVGLQTGAWAGADLYGKMAPWQADLPPRCRA
jgi:hypothetical protein